MSSSPATRSPTATKLFAARGALLTPEPDGGVRFERNGLLVWKDGGEILHAGPADRRFAGAMQVAGGERALIVAGFWDPHVHLPQLAIAGLYNEPLLSWLERRVYPEEARHKDRDVAAPAAERFFDALLAAGTVGAGIFAAPFLISAETALEEAARRGVPVRCGPSLMDRGEPRELVSDTLYWIAAASELLARFGPAAAIVPRFALTSSAELLAAMGDASRQYRARVLGHISETREEVEAVRAATGLGTYVEVYERAGLLGPRTILAHGIYLDEVELGVLAFSKTWIAHAPTSNLALGSGRFPLERARKAGVRWCLCSDVGAGPQLSMLHVIATFLEVHKGAARVDACEAFWRATWAGAEALGFGDEHGALMPGRQADFFVVDEGPRRVRSAEGALRELLGRASREAAWENVVGSVFVGGRRVN